MDAMKRLSDNRGFALPELLIVMTIAIVLLMATLITYENLLRGGRVNEKRNDTAQLARTALDQQAKQLRNLAKRINNVAVIDKVAPYEFIFQTSDPTRTWVRYCLDASTPTNGKLWVQSQANGTASVTAAMRTGCPSTSGWTRTVNVATNVTNRDNGQDRPVFSYRCVDGTSACANNAATYDQILTAGASLFVDTTPNKTPPEINVSSSVYLRNQNQAPKAVMTAKPSAGFPRTILFNASGSSDFEGRTLEYFWFLGTMPSTIRCDQRTPTTSGATKTLWGGNLIGQGITYQYTWPGSTPASGTAQTASLVACDPGDRYGYTGPQTVTIP
jgi:prepilin-type N-terminal cleavage/methylation domain-containing protein